MYIAICKCLVQTIQVALIQNWLTVHYAWFCHGRLQLVYLHVHVPTLYVYGKPSPPSPPPPPPPPTGKNCDVYICSLLFCRMIVTLTGQAVFDSLQTLKIQSLSLVAGTDWSR